MIKLIRKLISAIIECQEVLWFYAEDRARGKVIKVCKNPNCTMYNFQISFSER